MLNEISIDAKCSLKDNIFIDRDENSSSHGDAQLMMTLLNKTWDYIRQILLKYPPRCSVLLAFDGPGAMAKITSQRMRRLKQSIVKQTISPGSPWMNWIAKRLGKHVSIFLHERTASHRKTRKRRRETTENSVCTVVSDFNSPGEGEHKIIQRLFECSVSKILGGSNAKHLIVGSDSDLFIICAASISLHNLTLLNTSSKLLLCVGSVFRAWLAKAMEGN